MQRLEIMLIGAADYVEFAAARRQIEAAANVTIVDRIETAIEQFNETAPPPDLIVIAQRLPGEFAAEQCDKLQSTAPLSRVVVLLGSWCEGEPRTGDPWPAAIRVYWYRWKTFFAEELARRQAGEPPTWSLPLTATEEERALIAAADAVQQKIGCIAIAAGDSQTADWLADACGVAGYSTVWITPHRAPRVTGVHAIVWDAPRFDSRDVARLAALVRRWPDTPVVALLNNPRHEQIDQALAIGASTVVAKPLEIRELLAALDQALSHSAPVIA